MDAPATLLDQLIACGLLIPSGVDGIYARGIRFEDVVDALNAMVGRFGAIGHAGGFPLSAGDADSVPW